MLFCCSPSVKRIYLAHVRYFSAIVFPYMPLHSLTSALVQIPASTNNSTHVTTETCVILTEIGGFCHVRFYHTIPT